jgi:hypothetical protein
VNTNDEPGPDHAGAARAAYRRRVSARARRRRADTQLMRHQRERLALGYALRRELATLADGAADLLRTAQGQGKGAERAAVRLAARRRRAGSRQAGRSAPPGPRRARAERTVWSGPRPGGA